MSNRKPLGGIGFGGRLCVRVDVVGRFCLTFAVLVLFAPDAFAEKMYAVTAYGVVDVVETDEEKTLPGGSADESFTANGVTFNIWYEDGAGIGFNDGTERKARLNDALTYVAGVLGETGTLDILVQESESDASGFLAEAGTWFSVAKGFQNGTAFKRLTTGSKPFSTLEEIFVTVDWGWSWNTSTDSPTGSQYDLTSVLIHEITHGMGFLSLTNSDGTSYIGSGGVYTEYDGDLFTGDGTDLFTGSGASIVFNGTSTSLKGSQGGVELRGTNAEAAWTFGTYPPVYAPSSWQSGSSISHFDTGGKILGAAVMEPSISFGEEQRTYAPVDVGVLVDMGWSNAALPSVPTPVITSDGGNGPGVDYTTSNPSLTLSGTCDASAQEIQVNSSATGVTYTPGETTWSFAATLSEGANLFSVVAIDGVPNTSPADTITVTLDTTAPAVPVITTDGGNGAGVDYATSEASLSLAGTCDASSEEIQVNASTTGVTYTPGATTWSFSTTLSEGSNAFSVVAVDALLNASAEDTITVTLDTTAPAVPIITTDGGNGTGVDYTTSNAPLTLIGTCDATSQEIKVNASTTGVTYTPGATTWSFSTTLSEGSNAFSVVAVDALLNASAADTISVTLDTTAPAVPIITTDGGNGAGVDYTTSNASLTLVGTCGATSQEIKVNASTTGVTYSPGATTWSFSTTLSEGPNAFSVVAVDALLNTSGSDTITVTLDTTAPSAPVITTDGGNGAGADYATSNASLILVGTCGATSQEIKVNASTTGVTYTPGDTTWSFSTTLSEGSNAFSVVAVDALLNASAEDTITVALDTTAPAAPVITTDGGNGAGVDYATSEASLTLVGTCDATSQEIQVNASTTGVTYTPGDTTWSFSTTLSEGANAFSVVAIDALLNASAADTITVTLDTTLPATPVIDTDGGNGAGVDYATIEALLSLVGSCDASSQEIKVNGSTTGVTYTPGNTTWSFSTTLSEGANAFSVVAIDALLNVSAADTISVTLDTTAPAIPVITTDGGNGAGVDYATNEASLTLVGTCDATSQEIKVNASTTGVTYTPGETTWSFSTSLSEGSNAFSVVAVDALLNASGADTITVTLDTTAPAAPVISTNGGNGPGVDYATSETSLTLVGTCGVTSQEIQVNASTTGVTYTPGDTTWSFSATLSEGSNAFSVVAVDALLNASAADSITVTLDTTLPATPVIATDGGNGAGVDYATSEAFLSLAGSCDASSQEIKVNGSTTGVAYTPGDTTWSFSTTLSEGSSAFSVVAVDALLNSSAADTITVTLDTTAPATPVISTDGGNGAGVGYTTSEASLSLAGTCDASSEEIQVNASTTGVTYTPGATTWSFSTTLSEGANAFSVVAADALLNASAADSITVTLDTTELSAPVITTDGGNGEGVDYATNQAALTLEGTCGTVTNEIHVNGSATGVSYAPGETTWTYSTTLSEGDNPYSVTAYDAAGIASDPDTITIRLDSIQPVITLIGDVQVTVDLHSTYIDAGATASDNYDGDLTSSIVTVDPVDTSVPGDYTVTYNVTDTSGNAAVQVVRTVHVTANTGTVVIDVTPDSGGWSFIDADDETHTGTGDAEIADVPIGGIALTWHALAGYDLPTPDSETQQLENGETVTFTAMYMPVILEGPALSFIGHDWALVRWETSVPANSVVSYGTSSDNLDQNVTDGEFVELHSVSLEGLTPKVQYYLRVASTTAEGAGPVESETIDFTTLSESDITPPVITSGPMVIGISDSSASVFWTTDEQATSEVDYDDGVNGYQVVDDSFGTNHFVQLADLAASTQYNYTVASLDVSGNGPATSTTNVFATLSVPDTSAPLIIEGPQVTNVDQSSASIRWITNEPANGTIEYGLTENLDLTVSQDSPARLHLIRLVGLEPDSVYQYRVLSSDIIGNGPAESQIFSFKTHAVPDTHGPVFLDGPHVLYVADTRANIYWRTDEPSDSVVDYGIVGETPSQSSNPERVTEHQMTLVNLVRATEYVFVVSSTDLAGNTTTVGNTTKADSKAELYGFTTAQDPDIEAPVIAEGPEVIGVSNSTALVRWVTGEIADSRVYYGTDALDLFAGDTVHVFEHLVLLTNLAGSTEYSLQAGSVDPSENGPATSDTINFTTIAAPDEAAPEFTVGPDAVNIGADTATVQWTTGEFATSQVQYGLSQNDTSKIMTMTGRRLEHSVTLTNLTPETTYYYQAVSADYSANQSVSQPGQFTTPGKMPADINGDGIVNAVDVQLVINAALGIDTGYNCDVDSDGVVNAVDVQLVINAALGIW